MCPGSSALSISPIISGITIQDHVHNIAPQSRLLFIFLYSNLDIIILVLIWELAQVVLKFLFRRKVWLRHQGASVKNIHSFKLGNFIFNHFIHLNILTFIQSSKTEIKKNSRGTRNKRLFDENDVPGLNPVVRTPWLPAVGSNRKS